jgi:hypothetical protein
MSSNSDYTHVTNIYIHVHICNIYKFKLRTTTTSDIIIPSSINNMSSNFKEQSEQRKTKNNKMSSKND